MKQKIENSNIYSKKDNPIKNIHEKRSQSLERNQRFDQIISQSYATKGKISQSKKGGVILPPLKSNSFKKDDKDDISLNIKQKQNPFQIKASITTEDEMNSAQKDLNNQAKSKVSSLNKSQLATNMGHDGKEVELKVQSGENSQLFLENSIVSQSFNQSNMGSLQPQNQQTNDQSEKPNITVNLEDAVLQEQKLYSILESLRNSLNASLYCDDWWDITETENLTQIIATQVIKDIHLKQAILKAQKYETISIGIIQFYHLIANDTQQAQEKTNVNTSLKNLIFYIHQNYLIILQILLSRMMKRQGNYWASNLQKQIDNKRIKKVSTKGETIQYIKVYLANAENILRNLIKQNQQKKLFKTINDWINTIQIVTNEKIRETLYNIEQFRLDALSMASNSKTKQQPKTTGQVKGISQSTKTSGNSNLIGGQGNSITGKNPFAILKASAIASPATAVFPNNFTNLPKVSPPFLSVLADELKKTTYTLVLDLDETLIHNVDYGADSYFLVRPGCVYFIELMSKFYEIVIFTAALQDYADQVIDQIDVNGNIKQRLYRQHCSQNGPFLVKDLSLLGRDLSKTIIIDNISDNFILQPENGIFISTWYDDMSDNFLEQISPLLIEISEKKVLDVKKALRSYRDQILRQISNGAKEPHIQFD